MQGGLEGASTTLYAGPDSSGQDIAEKLAHKFRVPFYVSINITTGLDGGLEGAEKLFVQRELFSFLSALLAAEEEKDKEKDVKETPAAAAALS